MSYPIVYYDSEVKNQVINIIMSHFKDVKIIDPAKFMDFPHSNMRLYYFLVDDCDVLVYIPFIENTITAGVYSEVKYALEHGKMVYKYTTSELKKVKSLDDVRESVLDINETRRLYRTLQVIDEHILKTEIKEIEKQYPYISPKEALEILYQQKLLKYKSKLHIPPKYRWMHLWDFPLHVKLPLLQETRERLKKIIKQHGISMHRKDRPSFIYKKYDNVIVKSIIKLCKLKIPLIEIERAFNLPIDLADINLLKFAMHILNEGTVDRDELCYSNEDPILHVKYVIPLFHNILDKYALYIKYKHSDPVVNYRSSRVSISYFPSFLSSLLVKVGIPYGRKATTPPTFPIKYIIFDSNVANYYFQTLYTEEGTFVLSYSRKSIVKDIKVSRSHDITPYAKDYLDELQAGRMYYPKDLRKDFPELYKIGLSRPCPYFVQEGSAFLQSFPEFYPYTYTRLSYIYVSKNKNRITANHLLAIRGDQAVRLFFNRLGFLPGTWKDFWSRKLFKLYTAYRNGHISKSQFITDLKWLHDQRKSLMHQWVKEHKYLLNPYLRGDRDGENK